MKTKLGTEAKKIFDKYIRKYPEEFSGLKFLSEHLENAENLVSRGNLLGHITASALVLNNQNQILLIFHNKLKKFLQPGGHIENDNSLIESAMREVIEETKVGTQAHPTMMDNGLNLFMPIFINSHRVPENSKKGEPEHWHHDFMFVLIANNSSVQLDINEVADFKWVSLEEKFEGLELTMATKKLKKLIKK